MGTQVFKKCGYSSQRASIPIEPLRGVSKHGLGKAAVRPDIVGGGGEEEAETDRDEKRDRAKKERMHSFSRGQ